VYLCVLPSAISVPSENGRLKNNVYVSFSTSKQTKLLEKSSTHLRKKVKSIMTMPNTDTTNLSWCEVHIDHTFGHEHNCESQFGSQFVSQGQTASQHFYARIIQHL